MLRVGQMPSIRVPETINSTSLHLVGMTIQRIAEAAKSFIPTLSRMLLDARIAHNFPKTFRVTEVVDMHSYGLPRRF